MAGVAGWGSRKTLEELQARARQMYGPFRDETRTDPLTGLSYQFSDIRPGQDRTDPVWLTPEQNEATRAYFTDGGRIGDDGLIQKDVTKPAFSQNQDGSYSSGSATQTVTAPNVGTAWGYTGKPGVFTKTWGALTGDDFPDQVRAKTPWSEAAFNSVDPFLPWSEEEGARIPPAVSSLVTEPARLAEKGVKGQEFSPADNAILGMTLFAAGGVGKGLASGKQGGVLGRAGSKLGLEDPLLNTPETSIPSIAQNYRDAQSPMFAAGDERAALMAGAFAESNNPTVRAAQKRAADVPFADKLVTQHNMRGRSFDHNVSSYGGNIPVPSLALSKAGDPLTNFGDISLFGSPEMAIPKGSNPVYPGDAYTQRAPRLVRDVPKSADRDRLYEKLTGEKGKGYKLNLDDPFWDDGFRAGYLRSKGMTPPEGVDLDRWVRDNIGYGERDSVERFVSDFLDSHKGVIRERIDKGWSNDGERRLYAPHTLANMVKASKGRAGSEDFDYGPMAWKAATMSPFQSLRDRRSS